MARAWIVLGALGLLGACGDDGGGGAAPPTVSQEDYDAEAERLCGQHGEIIARAYSPVDDSDAEEAAFYTSDLIPRTRALVRRLADLGLPAERRDEYTAALNEVLAVMAELEADPIGYIDSRHEESRPLEEDLLTRLRAALDAADVPC